MQTANHAARFVRSGIIILIITCVASTTLARFFRVAHMARPPSLDETTELKVSGRQGFLPKRKISFGDYTAANIRRGWKRRTKLSIFGYAKERASQNYEFTLTTSAGETWQCQCMNGMKQKDMGRFFPDLAGGITINLSYETSLAAVLSPEGGGTEWALAMDTDTSTKKAIRELIQKGEFASLSVTSGMLTDGATQIMIEPVKGYEGSPLPTAEPTGYLFIKDGRVVGAVETINNGVVWLTNDLEGVPRTAVATTASALLLYKNLAED